MNTQINVGDKLLVTTRDHPWFYEGDIVYVDKVEHKSYINHTGNIVTQLTIWVVPCVESRSLFSFVVDPSDVKVLR